MAVSWAAQTLHRLLQNEIITGSPRNSDSRTLLPATAGSTKSGAGRPISPFGADVAASAAVAPMRMTIIAAAIDR
jgi:hypothetical protein